MAKNTNRLSAIKGQLSDVPKKPTRILPYDGELTPDMGFTFSFAAFDRGHKLFNLGGNGSDGVVPGGWFLDLLDCLKSIGKKTFAEIKQAPYSAHPVDWEKANTRKPDGGAQCEYWQFRLNKSKGRVIGTLIDGVFYVVWLDPHHNLTDSEGYGGVDWYKPGMSEWERQSEKLRQMEEENQKLREDLETMYELLG